MKYSQLIGEASKLSSMLLCAFAQACRASGVRIFCVLSNPAKLPPEMRESSYSHVCRRLGHSEIGQENLIERRSNYRESCLKFWGSTLLGKTPLACRSSSIRIQRHDKKISNEVSTALRCHITIASFLETG